MNDMDDINEDFFELDKDVKPKKDIELPSSTDFDNKSHEEIVESIFSEELAGTDLRTLKDPPKTPNVPQNSKTAHNVASNSHNNATDSLLQPDSGFLEKGSMRIKEETLIRAEEIEDKLIKENGRYIPAIDDVKIGVTIDGQKATEVKQSTPVEYAKQAYGYRSDNVNTHGEFTDIYDPGYDAQEEPNPIDDIEMSDNDPRSPNFVGCINNQCAYRDGCLRFRMKNKTQSNAPFFPEQCRIDGTYIGLDETDYTAYDDFDSVDNPITPVSLGPV